jgi:hypothetical protein
MKRFVFATLFALAACPDPVDKAAKKRIFSSEDPPQAVAAAQESLPPEDVASNPVVARRVLGMSAAEITERIGAHTYTATVNWEWSAGRKTVGLKESRELQAGEGGMSGDFLARITNTSTAGDVGSGLEVLRLGGQVYARTTYGKDGAGQFRERKRDRGIAERMRDEASGAVRDFDQLFRGRLLLTAKGTQTIAGRLCWKYDVSLGPPLVVDTKSLPPLATAKGGADDTTLRRRSFFDLREPKTLTGEVFVDSEKSVVLKATMNGRMRVASDGGDAELRLSLSSSLTNLGRPPELKTPQDFLPDEDKPQGIAATMLRFGIERGDGGTPASPGGPAEPEDE